MNSKQTQNSPVGTAGYSDYMTYKEYDRAFRKQGRKHLRRVGSFIGLGVLLYILLNNIIALAKSYFFTGFKHQELVDSALTIVGTTVYVGLSFLIVWLCLRKRETLVTFVPLEKPQGKLIPLYIPAGVALCMAANYVTAILVSLMDTAGVKLSQGDYASPTSTPVEIAVSFLAIAVMPAFMEEFALRGVVLQSLRQFGTGFAIVTSGLIFGIMHGNLIQAPFALAVGVVVGFIAVKTGSIWLGIAIHAINNGISVLGTVLKDLNHGTEIYGAVVLGITVAGVVCLIVLCVKDKTLFSKDRGNQTTAEGRALGFGEKVACMFLNVPMIIAIAYMCWVTAQYVALK